MTNPFNEIPQRARFIVYIVATLVVLAIGAWQTAEGNALEAIAAFAGALIPLMSASNSDKQTYIERVPKPHTSIKE